MGSTTANAVGVGLGRLPSPPHSPFCCRTGVVACNSGYEAGACRGGRRCRRRFHTCCPRCLCRIQRIFGNCWIYFFSKRNQEFPSLSYMDGGAVFTAMAHGMRQSIWTAPCGVLHQPHERFGAPEDISRSLCSRSHSEIPQLLSYEDYRQGLPTLLARGKLANFCMEPWCMGRLDVCDFFPVGRRRSVLFTRTTIFRGDTETGHSLSSYLLPKVLPTCMIKLLKVSLFVSNDSDAIWSNF